MYKIAVMGDRESIFAFSSFGFGVFTVDEAFEAAQLLDKLSDSGYAVIYITEALASKIPEKILRYREKKLPAVILIPGISGNTGDGMRAVHESVEKAVGSDILSNQ